MKGNFIECLCLCPGSLPLVIAGARFLQVGRDIQVKRGVELESTPAILESLSPNLGSEHFSLRRSTSRLLSSSSFEVDGIFRLCCDIHELSDSFVGLDGIRFALSRLNTLVTKNCGALSDNHVQALTYFVAGIIRTPISSIWPDAGAMLSSLLSLRWAVAWSIWRNLLEGYLENALRSDSLRQDDIPTPKPDDRMSLKESQSKKRIRTELQAEETRDAVRRKAMPRWDNTEWTTLGMKIPWDKAMNELILSFILPQGENTPRTTDPVTFYIQLIQCLRLSPKALCEADYLFSDLLIRVLIVFEEKGSGSTFASRRIVTKFLEYLDSAGGFRCLSSETHVLRLRTHILNLLMDPSEQLQQAALRCLTKSKAPELQKLKENLFRLASESTFRDELTNFVELLRSEVQGSTRELLIPILMRLLYGKTLVKSGGHQKSRRRAVLSFFESSFSQEEIDEALALITSKFDASVRLHQESETKERALDTERQDPPFSFWIGSLNTISDVIRDLGKSLGPESWKTIRRVVVDCFTISLSSSKAKSKELRVLSSNLLVEILEDGRIDALELSSVLKNFREMFAVLDLSGTRPPSLLVLLSVLSKQEVLLEKLASDGALEHLVLALSKTKLREPVLIYVLGILNRFRKCEGYENWRKVMSQGVLHQMNVFVEDLCTSAGKGHEHEWWEAASKLISFGIELCDSYESFDSVVHDVFDALLSVFRKGKKALRKMGTKKEMVVVSSLEGMATLLERYQELEVKQSISVRSLALLFNQTFCCPQSVARAALVRFFRAFRDERFHEALNMIERMTEMEPGRIGEPNFGARIDAVSEIVEQIQASESEPEVHNTRLSFLEDELSLYPLVFQTISSCLELDDTLRNSGFRLLISLSRYVIQKNFCDISQVFVKALRLACVNAASVDSQRQFSRALGECARTWQRQGKSVTECPSALASLLPICRSDGDLEADFFENIAHIQRHRRMRALRRVSELSMTSALAFSFVYPLALGMAVGDTTGEVFHSKSDNSSSMVEASMQACRAACQAFSWAQYRKTLTRLLRDLRECAIENVARHSILSKVLVGVVDALESILSRSEDVLSKMSFLRTRIFPNLLNTMVSTDRLGEQKFHSVIGCSTAKLLALVGLDDGEYLVPQLVTPLVGFLGTREEKTRVGARLALWVVLERCGPLIWRHILLEVQQRLKEGFRRHVLTYTVLYFLREIDALRMSGKSYVVDSGTDVVVAVAMEDLSGVVGEEKDHEGLSTQMKEFGGSRYGEIIRLQAKMIEFEASASILYGELSRVALSCVDLKIQKKVENALRCLCRGFMTNSSLTVVASLRFTHAIMTELLSVANPDSNDSMLLTFAADMLRLTLAKASSGPQSMSDEHLRMLPPFIPLLLRVVDSRSSSLSLVSLRIVQTLLRIPSICDQETSNTITKVSLKILSSPISMGGVGRDLFNTALRTVSVAVQEASESLVELRAEPLLLIARSYLTHDSVETRMAALNVVRVIVGRKIVLPQVYDLIDEIARLGIVSQHEGFRLQSVHVAVSFMLHYPLSRKRLRHHLNFYLRNLEFNLMDGRITALAALKAVVQRFPSEVIDQEAEYLFLPVCASLSNDQGTNCRDAAMEVLSELLGRASEEKLKLLQSIVQTWFRGGVSLRGLAKLCVLAFAESGRLTEPVARLFLEALCADLAPELQKGEVCLTLSVTEKVLDVFPDLVVCRVIVDLYGDSVVSEKILRVGSPACLAASRILRRHLELVLASSAKSSVSVLNVSGGPQSLLKLITRQLELITCSESELGEVLTYNLSRLATFVRNSEDLDAMTELAAAPDHVETGTVRRMMRHICGVAMCPPSDISVDDDAYRRGVALNCLRELSEQWGGPSSLVPYAGILVPSLFLTLERVGSMSTKVAALEPVSAIAKLLQEQLSSQMGARYFEVLSDFRGRKMAARRERQRQKALQAVVNPRAAAERKIRRNLAKRRQKLKRPKRWHEGPRPVVG